jgi:integrase
LKLLIRRTIFRPRNALPHANRTSDRPSTGVIHASEPLLASNKMSETARSPHGVRKTACRTLAEAGCTALEIMAITGHQDIKEIETYCAKANQKQLAAAAIKKVKRHETNDPEIKFG